MRKKIGELVCTELRTLLEPLGFVASKDALFYCRDVNGVAQAILFAKTRYAGQYTVVCSLAESEPGTGLAAVESKEHRERMGRSSLKFALSPVAPFQNTFDWDFGTEEAGQASIDQIVSLLKQLCLPVFGTVDTLQRLMQALSASWATVLAAELGRALSERITAAGFALDATGEFLWKRNGELAVIVLPSVVGVSCFLIPHVILWSPTLHGSTQMPALPPSDFSRVAFVKLAPSGITSDGLAPLWFIGNNESRANALAGIEAILCSEPFSDWLGRHATVAAVLDVVDPQLKPYVERRVREAM